MRSQNRVDKRQKLRIEDFMIRYFYNCPTHPITTRDRRKLSIFTRHSDAAGNQDVCLDRRRLSCCNKYGDHLQADSVGSPA